ncbi:MAG: hypothetical protein ABIG61_00740 [Planctomycetota bacterium]
MVSERIRKYSVDRVVLFLIFILGLVIAQVIVQSRGRISLSGPMKLDYTGISVRIPSGRGWVSNTTWVYYEDGYRLVSEYRPDGKHTSASVSCQYVLFFPSGGVDERFVQSAAVLGGEVIERGRFDSGGLLIEWARITVPRALQEVYIGFAQLPGNRGFVIQSTQIGPLEEPAFQAFELVAGSVEFGGNELLAKGISLAGSAHSGITSQLDKRFYLIKNSREQLVGFGYEMIKGSDNYGRGRVRAGSFSRFGNRLESYELFESESDLGLFSWSSHISRPLGMGGEDIRAEMIEEGLLRVESSALSRPKNKRIGPSSIPGIVVEPVLKNFLESGERAVVIDIVLAEGKVVPTLLSRVDLKEGNNNKQMRAVRMEFLDGRGYNQEVYFDKDGKTGRQIVRQEDTFTLERVAEKDLPDVFSGRKESIVRMEEWVREGGNSEKDILRRAEGNGAIGI